MNDNTHTPPSLAPVPRLRARLPAACLLALLCVALVAPAAHAEPDTFGLGDGTDGALTVNAETPVNAYAQVTAAVSAGQNFVEVGATEGFGDGDLVLVLQSTGLDTNPASGNQDFIDLTARAVGRWEFARVASAGVSENRLTFTQPLTVGFAAAVTQVVRVPEFTSVTVNAGGSIVAQPWDGAMGGVVIFLSQGAVTVNGGGVITASGRGFRGGVLSNGDGDGCTGFDAPYGTPDAFIGAGASKGEGVVPSRYSPAFPPTDGTTGYGNVANGAGGGICHNSGGGGGGGAGSGGKGGRTWSGENGGENAARDVGGLGGVQMRFNPLDHLLFGGGGGAGHGNDDLAGGGSAGGGIVFIRGGSLSGAGTISADGAAGQDSREAGNDAAGGAGAGGTLYLRFTGAFNCDAGLTVTARGGNGGSSLFPDHGTGGGGGGGRIHVQGFGLSPSCATRVVASGGQPGTQPNPDATDGQHYGAVAGNPGSITGLLTEMDPVDILGPGNNVVLTDSVVTYSGTAEPGATVTVVVDGQTVGTVTAAADGSWSLTAATPLPDGPHTVVATAVDSQGTTTTDTHTFRVDTGTSVAITVPADGAVLNTGLVTYRGTAEPGATVTVVVDGQTVGTAVAGADGTWSVAAATELGNGPHTVVATARDAQGHTATDTHAFTVDTQTSVDILAPGNNAVLNNGVVTYSGTAEPGATVTVVVDGQTVGTVTAAADGSWSVAAATELGNGPHTVVATARDAQGNTATDTHTFTVDTTTSVAITVPAEGAVLNNGQVTYRGTAEPGATVTVVVDGQTVGTAVAGADGSWSVASDTVLADGPHTVVATARDAQGNTATDTTAFRVDTQTAVSITTPAEGAVLTNSVVTYTGTAEPGATVTVVVDGQTVGTAVAAADGSWSVAVAAPLVNGPHTVTATATDTQGNTATDTNTFTVNTGTLPDSDGDGVDDATEIELGTDPRDADTDDDGVTDGADGLTDTDGDGTIDARDADSDNDGLLDGTERGVTLENAPAGTNTSSPNFRADNDPSTTTDPRRSDTDGDGLNDGVEDADHNGRVAATETDPNNPDTDGDSVRDGTEVNGTNATNPLDRDSDDDGLDDGVEDANRNGGLDNGETDPNNRDTDLGGASDGEEATGGGNPLDGNDDFVVVGRGCSTSGAGTFAPLALLLLALPLLGRLRRQGGRPSQALVAGAAGGLALAGVLVAQPAVAQVTAPTASQAIDVQQYKPGPGAGDILGVHSARVQPHLGWNVGLSLNYADKPLNFLDPRQDRFITALVRSQVGLDLMGAVGLFDRFELGVLLPVTLQDSEAAPQVDPSFAQGVGSGGIGDLRVVPKARLVDGEDFDLALAVPVVLPTGGASDFLGGSGVGVQPRLVAEYGQRLRLAANLGVDLRGKQQLRNLHTGNELAFGVGAELPFTVGELPLAAAATLVGGLGLEEQDTEERPLELLAALKYRSVGGFSAHVGAGPGLTRGYGTPGFRVLGGLSYSPEPSRQPKAAPPPAPVDSDGDGLVDGNDSCPTEAEDKDGHEDADGCPDPDNDQDGIVDGSDRCVSEPETKNGHEDADGCPELDNDRDGIPDTADKCPAEPEVINGVQDEDGCPDKGKVKVQVDGERILILEKVYFATSKDVILPRSFALLKQVAAVLRANPQVELLRVEGHTDDQGSDAKNLDLSQRRAANVRAFLVKEGIAANRLESEGYGETKPVDTNKTAKGRENNRRVEFTILRMGKVEVEREAP